MPGQISVKDLIRQEAAAAGVPEELALAVAEQESGFNPTAQGPAIPHLGGTRAIGTFQLLPDTAKMLGVDPTDPVQNIRGGTKYLRQLLDQHNGDLQQVLKTYGGVKNNTTYVPQVLERLPRFQRGVTPSTIATPPPTPPGAGEKFFGEATKSIDPRNIWQGIKTLATTPPADTAKALWRASAEPFQEGDYLKAVPLIGPRMAESRDFAKEGEYAKAAGAAVDVAGQVFGPKLLSKAGGRLPITPKLFKSSLTGEQAAAVELGMAEGVTMDVPTVTGSRFARNITQAAEATPLGSVVNQAVKASRQEQLPRLAEKLADRVHPTPVTPGEAGVGLRTGAGNYLTGRQAAASAAYDTVETIQAQPQFRQLVQTGTRPAWNNASAQIPVMEWVQAPVDLRGVKAALAPIRDEIKHQMTLGKQQYSEGLLALDNLMALRDFEPVAIAEKNLSAVKGVARGAEHQALRGVEQGTAAKAVGELSQAVDQTMARLGPQAQQALAEGRAAAKAKWAAQDLFKAVDTEAVQGFRTVTGTGDLHAEALAQVAQVAPQEIPRVGRAVLENIYDQARGLEHGWSRHASVANQWERLGPQTKQILFGQNVDELNHFFLLQKMLAEQANPSRTALVGTSVGSLGLVAANPFWGVMSTITAGGFAALMNSRLGIQLLTKGLTIPAGTAQAAAWAAEVARAAGEQVERVGSAPPAPPSAQVATPPPRQRRYLGGSRWLEERPATPPAP